MTDRLCAQQTTAAEDKADGAAADEEAAAAEEAVPAEEAVAAEVAAPAGGVPVEPFADTMRTQFADLQRQIVAHQTRMLATQEAAPAPAAPGPPAAPSSATAAPAEEAAEFQVSALDRLTSRV